MKIFNKVIHFFIISILVINVTSCSSDDSTTDTPEISENGSPNILFIIADDLGKDAINGFSEGSIKPNTPHIDAIRNNGLSFSNFWVYPTCTPTRASIITGKYGYRTEVKNAGDILSPLETTLQQYIKENTANEYASAIVGKWHLSGNQTGVNPENFGIDYYSGLIRGAADNYYQWQLTEDGATSVQNEYITTVFTDLAIDWVDQQSKPWFLWLAYTAPHTPFHAPPVETHSQGDLPDYVDGEDPLPYYMAAIESMDYEIGRLLDTLPEEERNNTIIIFIGDNGTPNQVAQSPYSSNKVKNTLYQGGINTPMFISGAGVDRRGVDNNLLTGTDLFSTIAEIAGVSVSEIHDSKSFKSLLSTTGQIRNYQYAEMDTGMTDAWTISNGSFKLFVDADGNEEMYDLSIDAYETNNLLGGTLTPDQQNQKSLLEQELSRIRN